MYTFIHIVYFIINILICQNISKWLKYVTF
nr:MAG TPA: hypothetical protein [Caudoviricetes sp.]DAY57382.1 MAG TPA: hypothetical protein [Caudoviricetes sp.]